MGRQRLNNLMHCKVNLVLSLILWNWGWIQIQIRIWDWSRNCRILDRIWYLRNCRIFFWLLSISLSLLCLLWLYTLNLLIYLLLASLKSQIWLTFLHIEYCCLLLIHRFLFNVSFWSFEMNFYANRFEVIDFKNKEQFKSLKINYQKVINF